MYTTTAVQWTQIFTPAHGATTNSTEQAKSPANQTGEKMQAGAANVTQGTKLQQTKQEKKCRLEPLMLHKELNLSKPNRRKNAGWSLMLHKELNLQRIKQGKQDNLS